MEEKELLEELDILIKNMELGSFDFDMVLRNLISLKNQIELEGID